ncbi:RDD family protein [Clostridium butyricum]|uniref:RDD family protein n=1 Tax=Clostridium butyricum TaxID=1492 RepID=UPI0018ABB938|nr:RDD family protein [Clostridium butyricum]
MEKDNVKENETEVNTDEKEENSVELSKEHEENTNNELQDLIEDHEEVDSKENNKPSFGKEIFANLLDQFVILAGSAVILLIADVVMRMFGYQFVRETGILVAVVMCVYFVINCFYVQLMERTKLKNTIAKKILNL